MHDPLPPDDVDALNQMLGRAVFDVAFCTLLLGQNERVYRTEYHVTESTWCWIKGLQVTSLQQLAQAILCRITPEDA